MNHPENPTWTQLRHFWLGLSPADEAGREEQQKAHRAILDRLVQDGVLEEAVAGQLQIAFAEASFHVWRASTSTTCYRYDTATALEIRSREDLLKQVKLLDEYARSGNLAEEIVAEARAAIENDLAFMGEIAQLSLLSESTRRMARAMLVRSAVDEMLDISPEAEQAAGVLVDLLLMNQGE